MTSDNKTDNPFQYGSMISENSFCGRNELLARLKGYVSSNQNFALVGERRIGKSSLISKLGSETSYFLYTDFMEVKDISDLLERLIRAFFMFQTQKGIFEKFLRTITHLRPTLGTDPLTGTPTISIDVSHPHKPETIGEIFSQFRAFSTKKKLFVAIDEFQDILKLKDHKQTLAILRSEIQHHHGISYCFSGSVRHQMDSIFFKPNSPFYKSALVVNVGPIERDEFVSFIKKRFRSGKREIKNEILDQIFNVTYSISGDVQQICHALWDVTKPNSTIDQEKFTHALELIFSQELKSYQWILAELTAFQQRLMKVLAKLGTSAITSNAVMREAGATNASVVRKTVLALVAKQVLYETISEEGTKEFRFFNPFFKFWILHGGI